MCQSLFGACAAAWYAVEVSAVLDGSTRACGGASDGHPSCCCYVCAEHGRELQQQCKQQEPVDGVVSDHLATHQQQQLSHAEATWAHTRTLAWESLRF